MTLLRFSLHSYVSGKIIHYISSIKRMFELIGFEILLINVRSDLNQFGFFSVANFIRVGDIEKVEFRIDRDRNIFPNVP